MKTYRIESKDFYTCWKALSHSERIFQDAILRKDFPKIPVRMSSWGTLPISRKPRIKSRRCSRWKIRFLRFTDVQGILR